MRRWFLLLLVALVLGLGVYAYQTAKPWVHPIKQADAARMANLSSAAEPATLAPEEADPEQASTVEWFGKAQAVDGDTLRIDGTDLNLWAIDAPEPDQTCERDGKPWRCGDFARAELDRLIAGRTVACVPEGPDTPPAVSCFVRETRCDGAEACDTSLGSLNLAMIERGAAVDIEGHFADSEDVAHKERRGVWASRFQKPWDYRGVAAGF